MLRRRALFVLIVIVGACATGFVIWYSAGGSLGSRTTTTPEAREGVSVSAVPGGDSLKYRLPATYTCVAVADNVAWVGTEEGWVERWDLRSDTVKRFACAGDKERGEPSRVRDLEIDVQGQVWLCTRHTDEVYRLDGEKFRRIGALKSVALKYDVFAVTDKAGQKWLAAGPDAGMVYGKEGWHIAAVPGHPEYEVGTAAVYYELPLAVDQDGILWAVLYNSILAASEGDEGWYPTAIGAFDGREWRIYGPDDGINEWSWTHTLYLDSRGKLWYHEDRRVLGFDGEEWRIALNTEEWPHISFGGQFAVDRSGAVWISGGDGDVDATVIRFDGEKCKVYGDGLSLVPREDGLLNFILAIKTDDQDRVFVLTCHWLAVIEDDEVRLVAE